MNDKKEAAWFAVVTGTGMLFLLIFYVTGQMTAAYLATGDASVSLIYWLLVAVSLFLCTLIAYLLKESELFFRINAIALTAILPAVVVTFLAFWYLMYG